MSPLCAISGPALGEDPKGHAKVGIHIRAARYTKPLPVMISFETSNILLWII